MSMFDRFNMDDFINDNNNCEGDDCQPLVDTAKIVMTHLRDHYGDPEHKSMTPPCVICVTFHLANMMGITMALRHPEDLPLELRRAVLAEEFPDPF